MLSPIKHTLALFFALVGVFTMLSLISAMPVFDTNTTSGDTDDLAIRLEKPYIGVCFDYANCKESSPYTDIEGDGHHNVILGARCSSFLPAINEGKLCTQGCGARGCHKPEIAKCMNGAWKAFCA
ncbi:hypothetical protein BDZ90DRAFT_258268 [Jaminaea rosea]|uniref:Uncharacterized protein n=1 Tax=Jaminaea rosea TaxID=1569628 RepID=A0A316UX12_9BASI|nr:hypothetical protein BDZ90DRAFT_258268 [Jaminaea rosea]PWN29328.1 hypothetical protein BDZ90DRAFT_258268 [Jaminaea rosea]